MPVGVAIAGCNAAPPAQAPSTSEVPAAAPAVSQVERGRMLDHRRRLPRLPYAEEDGAGRPRGRHGSHADRVTRRARACRRRSSNQGQPLCDSHQRSPDGVERRLGCLVCREPDTRSEHRPRHLDRGHVRGGAQTGQAHGKEPADSAAHAVELVRTAAGGRSEGDVRVSEVDQADRQPRAGAADARRQADRSNPEAGR